MLRSQALLEPTVSSFPHIIFPVSPSRYAAAPLLPFACPCSELVRRLLAAPLNSEAMAQESWEVETDDTGCQPPEGPVLCLNKCGFFGSAATRNLCSKCYRDAVLKQTKDSKASMSEPAQTEHLVLLNRVEDHSQQQTPREAASSSHLVASCSCPSQQPAKMRPNRCHTCNKHVGLTGVKCRCGDLFCSLHRYSDKHNCPFDYRGSGQDAIAKANPVVKPEKLDKI